MVQQTQIQLIECWKNKLSKELSAPYMKALHSFLDMEMYKGKVIFPEPSLWFNALNSTKFKDVKVVILGQDPYHGEGQAHGLSFSVQHGVKPPPSLKNIYKELSDDVAFKAPTHGCLQSWAEQGVLLLNSVLTVEKGQPSSHAGKGWETFTDAIIHKFSSEKSSIVFLLWGAYAQKKGALIDRKKHLVLQAPHPSPFAAHKGFFGCKHFSQTNTYLAQKSQTPIQWQL